jgi:hypothetical protein
MSVAPTPQPAAGAESWGRSERRDAGAAVRRVGREAGDPERQSGPKSPRACRTLRGSRRARRNSVARRAFVEVGHTRRRRVGACPYALRGAGLAPVDASRHATRGVSHLRKSKPYA